MLQIVSVLLQINFLALVICKQLSVPEHCRDQPSSSAFLFLARQQLGKSYKLFIHWLLAEIHWMLINSCDVWSLRYLGAESSWLWLSCISKELLHFLSIYWCVRQLVHIWFVGKLIKFTHKRWMSKALWYYRYIGLTMCVSLNTDLFVLHYCQCHTYIRSSYLMYQFYQDKRRGTRIKKFIAILKDKYFFTVKSH